VIAKKNGWSTTISNGGGTLITANVAVTVTLVAAAASVPVSSTLM
jgi:hypothetical protein